MCHLKFRCFHIISYGQTGECLRTHLVAYRVLMLHFAFKHYAAGLKAPMRVVWKASCCKVCWSLQLIQHEVWIQVSQGRRAYRPADGHASTVRHMRASNNLQAHKPAERPTQPGRRLLQPRCCFQKNSKEESLPAELVASQVRLPSSRRRAVYELNLRPPLQI